MRTFGGRSIILFLYGKVEGLKKDNVPIPTKYFVFCRKPRRVYNVILRYIILEAVTLCFYSPFPRHFVDFFENKPVKILIFIVRIVPKNPRTRY